MGFFRCRHCGREYEKLPVSCFCGNDNPALWDVITDTAPRKTPTEEGYGTSQASPAPKTPTAGGYGTQQANPAPKPPTAGGYGTQQANPAPKPPTAGGYGTPQGYPTSKTPAAGGYGIERPAGQTVPPAGNPVPTPPVQPQGAARKKSKVPALIAILLAAALLIAGGVILIPKLLDGMAPDTTETQPDNKGDKKVTPSPATEKITVGRLTMDVPAGFTFYEEDDNGVYYINADDSVALGVIPFSVPLSNWLAHYDSISEALANLLDRDDTPYTAQETTIDGHYAVYGDFYGPDENEENEIILIQDTDDEAVMLIISYTDYKSLSEADKQALQSAAQSISID